ncbi:hypothetical protein NCC78_16230 [Micromonospora phytophila]|uniref:hypothetical protein n=1 Tax=Micromonospora phytophila TaxID=709888 RepID=UPI00202F3E2E|nr:hypothetical protein [Micromonospora phytophila]MCM0676226.1 hypothetical protein [Micromonospora phytophila]
MVVVVVVAFCGVGGWLAFRDPLTPEQVVYRYFEALADRDADEARSYLVRHPDEDVETVLLDDDTVEHEDYTPPDHLEIEELVPGESGLVATMQVTYRVAGATYNREFRFTRDYPQQSWRIYRGWFSLPANTRTAYPLMIAGTLVPKSDFGQVVAFPGAYVVRVARNPIVEASPVTVVAGTGEAPALQLRLRGDRQPELERQVRAHLDGCAARPDPEPIGCPFDRLPDVDYPPTVQRRIVTYPSVELLLDDGDMLVVSGSPGRAEVRDPAAGKSSPPIAEEQFAVIGSLRVDGERFTYVPE